MQRASKLFNDESRRRINAAISAAESNTSAEIVPVVASASGRYDRAEDMAGLCLALLAMTASWLLFQREDTSTGSWAGPHLGLNFWQLLIIAVLAFIVGAFAASHIHWLRRLFTTRAEMTAEINARAHQVFFDQRMHHTAGHGGVLLYVSLYERMAAVIGDDAVVEKLGKPVIEDLCKQFTAALRRGNIVEALGGIIKTTGQTLAPVLPRQSGDVNELPDALVTVD